MFLTFLGQLPKPVLVIMSITILVLTIGTLVILVSALLSEVVCERVIRLINAIATLTGKDVQQKKTRRQRGK